MAYGTSTSGIDTAYPNKTLVQKILDRHGRLVTLRQPYDDSFGDIIDFCEPGLLSWDRNTEGEFRGERIYEGTPPWALRTMTDGWIGNTVSESNPWLKYLFPALTGNDDVNGWLQDLEDHLYPVYRESELYPSLPSFVRTALSVGSPVIIPSEDRDKQSPSYGKIKCEVPHPRESYHGSNGVYHREFQLTVLDAVREFMGGKVPIEGKDETVKATYTTDEKKNDDVVPVEGKLNRALLQDYYNGNHFVKYTFIRAIYRKDDPILKNERITFRNKPWMEFYVQKDASDTEQTNEPIKVQGYWTKPHLRWDYEINDDEFYARTPAWHAMMDIKSGQEFAKQRLERGQQELHPPMWAQRKFKGRMNMRPKGFTYYDNPDEYQNIPKPILDRSRYDVGKDVHDMINRSVERWFHVPLFRMLQRISEEKKGWPTATQIIHLNAEQMILLAPLIGRWTNVLREIDTRFFDIERRAGRLPPPPDIFLEYQAYRQTMGDTKTRIDVEFIGPFMQTQQRSLAVRRIETGLAIAEKFINVFGEQLAYKVRSSTALERALEQVGFTQDDIVPEDEYQKTLADIAQQEQADKQAEQLAQVADAVPKLSKAVESGSPIAGLLGEGEAG